MSAGTLAPSPNYVPQRLTAERAYVCVVLAPHEVIGGVIVYESVHDEGTPDLVFGTLTMGTGEPVLWGPARRITVDDPFSFVNQAAGADVGDHNVRTRRATWNISIDAMIDDRWREKYASWDWELAPHGAGDGRFGTYLGRVVHVVVMNTAQIPIVAGTGLLQAGHIDMNAADGEPVARNIKVIRHRGDVKGNLMWADIEQGSWGVSA